LVNVRVSVDDGRTTASLDRIMSDIRMWNGDLDEILTSHYPPWMFNFFQSTYTVPTSCAPGKATYLLKMAAILPYAGNNIGCVQGGEGQMKPTKAAVYTNKRKRDNTGECVSVRACAMTVAAEAAAAELPLLRLQDGSVRVDGCVTV